MVLLNGVTVMVVMVIVMVMVKAADVGSATAACCLRCYPRETQEMGEGRYPSIGSRGVGVVVDANVGKFLDLTILLRHNIS